MAAILRALSTVMNEKILLIKLKDSCNLHFNVYSESNVLHSERCWQTVDVTVAWRQKNTSTWRKYSCAYQRTIALEKKNWLGRNIPLAEINLLMPEVIIAFKLLRILIFLCYACKYQHNFKFMLTSEDVSETSFKRGTKHNIKQFHSCYGKTSMESMASEHGKQCMLCSSVIR